MTIATSKTSFMLVVFKASC